MYKPVSKNLGPEDVSEVFASTVDANIEYFAKAYITLLHRGSLLKPLSKIQPEITPLRRLRKVLFTDRNRIGEESENDYFSQP